MKTRVINPRDVKDSLTMKAMAANESTLIPRMDLRAMMDSGLMGFDGKRNYYESLGYPTRLIYEYFYDLYKRGDLASRVIDAYPDATWRDKPLVYEKEKKFEESNKFNEAWTTLVEEQKIYSYFNRVDKLSRIGEYAALYMGFNDVTEDTGSLKKPLTKKAKLLYLLPRGQNHAEIKAYNTDKRSDNYGKPEIYEITFSTTDIAAIPGGIPRKSNLPAKALVHASRVLHVAEGLLEDDIFGIPALQAIFNRFLDIQKVVGGSAEMYWQGAFFGLAFNADADAELTDEKRAQMGVEIDEFMHGLRRYLKLQGISVDSITPQLSSPADHYQVLLSIVAGTTKMPIRLLTGSGGGEASSEQDDKNWRSAVDERREDFADPWILKAFVNHLQEYEIVPDVAYVVEWPDIYLPSAKDKANLVRIQTESLANYSRAEGSEDILPPNVFLTEFLGVTPDIMKKIEKEREERAKELEKEEKQMEADLKKMELDQGTLPVEDRNNPVSEVVRARQGKR